MKFLLATVIAAAIGASALPSPQTGDDIFCTEVCHLEKPVCPEGQAPTGSEGCWGCCKPILTPRACTLCLEEKPHCPAGEAPTGREGCWGCCVPVITPRACALCLPYKPECREDEFLTGVEGCWGCCVPINPL